jgi:UPF0716 family protein affecting phage T7 exclusion
MLVVQTKIKGVSMACSHGRHTFKKLRRIAAAGSGVDKPADLMEA